MSGAHNVMLTLEDLSLEEIETFCTHYEKLAMTLVKNSDGVKPIPVSPRLPLDSAFRLIEVDSLFPGTAA